MLIDKGERGPAGVAVHVMLDDDLLENPSWVATVSQWFITCKGQSPMWEHYILGMVHLREIPGGAPAKINIPHATHEIILYALDPDKNPVANDHNTWRPLIPLNFTLQVELPSDSAAAYLTDQCARAVVNGQLWAEPPLAGQKEPWMTTVLQSAAHLRGEVHGIG